MRTARALEEMPETRRALDEGELSMSAVGVLVSARDADPEAFRDSEAQLVEAARIHSMHDLRRVAAYWRQAVQRRAALDGDERLRDQRRLHASVTFLGMVRVDGTLDPETGETLLTALQAVLDAEARAGPPGIDRTPAQRRADALGEICRQWLDLAERPTVGGERPHVNLTVGLEALAQPEEATDGTAAAEEQRSIAEEGPVAAAEEGPVAAAVSGDRDVLRELDHVGPVGPTVARRLVCDASIRRIVMAGRSEPLDVGRQTPVVPPALRRAVIARDRHCRFPGCDRPHTWCDAHHVVHWADGGPTALANLVLLCRRHHRMLHARGRGGFRLGVEDGWPVFRRPDGSVLEDRPPP